MKRAEMFSRWFAVLVLLGMVTFCANAESTIRVHMIDAQSGQPMPNSPVRLWTTQVASYRTHPGYVQQMTDSNGVATFRVPDPQPTYLYIHVGMDSRWDECTSDRQAGYVAKDILDSGVSKEDACGKFPDVSSKFHPSGGDVYVFVKHNKFFQRMKKAAVDPG